MFLRIIKKILKIFLRPKLFAKVSGVAIGSDCIIMTKEFGSEPYMIQIGNNVEITSGVRFINHDGSLWCVRNLYKEYRNADIIEPIKIGNNVFIGNNTIILYGVTIADNTIIGANSLLLSSRQYGPGVYGGVPASYICSIEEFVAKKKSKFELTKKMTPRQKKKYYSSVR